MQSPRPKGRPSAFEELFERSRLGMLLADDQRRYVAVNAAACGMLGLSREEMIGRRIDDFTPAEAKAALESRWQGFLDEEAQAGEYEFVLPDRGRRRFEYSATANIEPGRHLSIILSVSGESDVRDEDSAIGQDGARSQRLSTREQEVMTHLAAGESGTEIAQALGISTETVRNHVRNARTKLGARTRAHAIALALRRGELHR